MLVSFMPAWISGGAEVACAVESELGVDDADPHLMRGLQFVANYLEDAAVAAMAVDDVQRRAGVARANSPTMALSRVANAAILRETVPSAHEYSKDSRTAARGAPRGRVGCRSGR
nr:hypothetical protein [Salinispora arenicola]